jgi:hypothetical protein
MKTRWRWVDQLHTPAALPLGKEPLLPIGWEASWAPQLMWTLEKRKICCPCWESNFCSLVILPIAHCYTDWAILAPGQFLCSIGNVFDCSKLFNHSTCMRHFVMKDKHVLLSCVCVCSRSNCWVSRWIFGIPDWTLPCKCPYLLCVC